MALLLIVWFWLLIVDSLALLDDRLGDFLNDLHRRYLCKNRCAFISFRSNLSRFIALVTIAAEVIVAVIVGIAAYVEPFIALSGLPTKIAHNFIPAIVAST